MSARTFSKRASEGFSQEHSHPDWPKILVDAVTKPGVISKAYSHFWNYSVGNQLLAWFQCVKRHIEPGPIHTFQGWKEVGRNVKKGERALTLCMPVKVKRKAHEPAFDDEPPRTGGDGAERIQEVVTFARFVYRPHWFVLAQTEGKEYEPVEIPKWNEKRALENLQITRIPFKHHDGNAQGYAVVRQVTVSLIAFMPHRTLFHEIAHVLLGHTEELRRMDDDDRTTPRDIREVEAECVALLCCESLGLPGAEFSRGYIQHWIKGKEFPDRSAQKIFKAADEVLRAGRNVGCP